MVLVTSSMRPLLLWFSCFTCKVTFQELQNNESCVHHVLREPNFVTDAQAAHGHEVKSGHIWGPFIRILLELNINLKCLDLFIYNNVTCIIFIDIIDHTSQNYNNLVSLA